MFYDQNSYNLRCEWGLRGVMTLAPISNVIIIVDILSFSTCIDIATSRNANVLPYRWKDQTAAAFAESHGAVLAGHRSPTNELSLSPASLLHILPGTNLVLPSPNGSTLSLATQQTITLCGSLRNCRAVANFALQLGKNIAVIPTGERWEDDSLRPAVEDLVGAGSILRYLPGTRSPESQTAIAAFESAAVDMIGFLKNSISGKQLIERNYEQDVLLAADIDCSQSVPLLKNGAFRNQVNAI